MIIVFWVPFVETDDITYKVNILNKQLYRNCCIFRFMEIGKIRSKWNEKFNKCKGKHIFRTEKSQNFVS